MNSDVVRTYELGRTDIRVSPIGLGCWQFAGGLGGGYWGAVEAGVVREIVEVSVKGGVNWFDTAEAYGFGRSERALSGALTELQLPPDSAVVATKWFPLFRFAGSIVRTFDKRQDALGAYSIDLHQVHFPMSFSSIPAQMERMADLMDTGKVRAVGVSNFSTEQMRRAAETLERRGYSLASNQVRYSLLDRSIEENGVLDAARDLGVTIIAYSPLAQGILTGKFHENPDLVRSRPGPRRFLSRFRESGLRRSAPLVAALRDIAEVHQATPAQVALASLTQRHGRTVVAIPGATKRHHAEQNAGALTVELTQRELVTLWDASREVGRL
jgi:aryl-alcohol dehydrogenase-like predicted oxidoreductase